MENDARELVALKKQVTFTDDEILVGSESLKINWNLSRAWSATSTASTAASPHYDDKCDDYSPQSLSPHTPLNSQVLSDSEASDEDEDEELLVNEIEADNVVGLQVRMEDVSDGESAMAVARSYTPSPENIRGEPVAQPVAQPVAPVISEIANVVGAELHRMALTMGIAPGELKNPSLYHGIAVPDISMELYLAKLQDLCHVSDECLIICLIYAKRLVAMRWDVRFNLLTVHRIALSCCVIAAKFVEDIYYTNSCYARGGGVHMTRELNMLEKETLYGLNFELFVDVDLYDFYLQSLLSGSPIPFC